MADTLVEPYAAAVRKLLRSVVYHDDTATWQAIRDFELPIREYLQRIGLGLHLDEIGSFAYLYDLSRDEDNPLALPALTTRRTLSFSDTLLLVLLRERLDEHEQRDLDRAPLRLTERDLLDMLQVFVQAYGDARKTEANATASIARLTRYGFLTKSSDTRYEVRPLIRAKINADTLTDIKARLVEYLQQTNGMDSDNDDESV